MNTLGKIKKVIKNPTILLDYFLKITETYSQTGEDLIIKHHIGDKKLKEMGNKGTYIDIGANQPKHLNNTYLFYKMGRGG